MASYQRASLPENFYDKVSDMLLVQPEPQFLYGQMWLAAMGASLSVGGSEFGLPGRTLPGAGASYSSDSRDRAMFADPLSPQLVGAKVDFNAQPGNTIKINRPAFANTTYTETSRRIASGVTISTTGITVGSEQTNLTLFRYGGPYDSTNTRVAPYAIEAFDANMGVHKAASIHGTHLKRDFMKFVDKVQLDLLDLAATAVYPEGMTAVDDATTASSFPLTYEQISRTEQLMDDANLPTFADGYRLLVLTPTQLKQLKDDAQYQRYAAGNGNPAAAQFNPLFPQYVDSIGKFHIFKNTTLKTLNNSSSVAIHYGHAIAPGVLLGGMGRAPRVVPNTNDNYGETILVMWLADLAFGLADNRFVYSVRSSA